MRFRKHFDYDVEQASSSACVDPSTYGPSLTVQSQSEETDLNVLMKRFGVTGHFPQNPRVPTYADFSDVRDFKGALAAVMDAQEKFMEYPAEVRARFFNDPQKMLEFCADDANLDEAVKLGFMRKEFVDGRRQSASGQGGGGDSDRQAVQPGQGVTGSPPGGSQGPAAGGPASGVGR